MPVSEQQLSNWEALEVTDRVPRKEAVAILCKEVRRLHGELLQLEERVATPKPASSRGPELWSVPWRTVGDARDRGIWVPAEVPDKARIFKGDTSCAVNPLARIEKQRAQLDIHWDLRVEWPR